MACACGGKMRWMRRRPAEVSVSRTARRSVPLCRRRTSPRLTSLSTTYVVLDDSTRMRRCTSHTGSSPLWYSTSSTPNSVVPSPKRAMLAREWRSTASNARASTIHSLRGVGEGGDGFISLQEPWLQGKCSTLVDIEYLDFEIHCPSAWEVSNVGRSGTVGFAADARGGVSGPRGAEVGGRVRRPGLCGRHRVHREHRIPPSAGLDGARRRRGVGRWVAVCAGVVDPARRVAGARDYGGRDRQGAWAQGFLQPERRVRVQPGADHRRPGCGGARAGGLLARPPVGVGAVVATMWGRSMLRPYLDS